MERNNKEIKIAPHNGNPRRLRLGPPQPPIRDGRVLLPRVSLDRRARRHGIPSGEAQHQVRKPARERRPPNRPREAESQRGPRQTPRALENSPAAALDRPNDRRRAPTERAGGIPAVAQDFGDVAGGRRNSAHALREKFGILAAVVARRREE